MLFTYYENENKQLLRTVNQSTVNSEEMERLERAIANKENLLKDLCWNKNASYAYLCDQIAQTVPKSIMLEALAINPVMSTAFNESNVNQVFQNGKIIINGQTSGIQPVNELMYQLQSKVWIKKVTLDSFTPNDEIGLEKFSLTILY